MVMNYWHSTINIEYPIRRLELATSLQYDKQTSFTTRNRGENLYKSEVCNRIVINVYHLMFAYKWVRVFFALPIFTRPSNNIFYHILKLALSAKFRHKNSKYTLSFDVFALDEWTRKITQQIYMYLYICIRVLWTYEEAKFLVPTRMANEIVTVGARDLDVESPSRTWLSSEQEQWGRI